MIKDITLITKINQYVTTNKNAPTAKHINNIYDNNELLPVSICSKMEQVQNESVKYAAEKIIQLI